MTIQRENLGPAERIIQTILACSDHAVHNRTGIVTTDQSRPAGVRWEPATYREEDDKKVVYRLTKVGKRTNRVRVGTLWADGTVRTEDRRKVGDFRQAGLFPEVVTWLYRQVAEVYKLDNEFAARWASFAFGEEHRDLKVVLAAFMLVQSRKGDPVREGSEVVFYDENYRDVGEAMVLIRRKDGKDLNPKLLLRIHDILMLDEIAQINRELGFGNSARRPFLGRWAKAVDSWLRFRERNIPLLEGLVRAGFKETVKELARRVGYKPDSAKFFEVLRWKQSQAEDGRRTLAIGQSLAAAETWDGMTERQICEKIEQDRPNFKRIVGLLPKDIGLTRAIVSAAVESNCLSVKDMVIYTPTLEDLGLLQVPQVREKWEASLKASEDSRALNIAQRVKTKDAQEKLREAADTALQKAVEQEMKNLRIYFMVDVSSSMTQSIEGAKEIIGKFLQAFPLDRVHVAVFNTSGREITVRHASAAGVTQAFRGITACGGTDYGAGVRALQQHKPNPDEDVLFFWVGDEEASEFSNAVRSSGLNPMAFAFLKVGGHLGYNAVTATAANLGIPCLMVNERTFDDTYAIPRTIRTLIASTPVGTVATRTVQRETLVDRILKTELLQKPNWAVLS